MTIEVEAATVGLGIRSPMVIGLVLGSAAAYVAAMSLMKLWDNLPLALVVVALSLCLVAAVWFEILALREARLGMVYVAILGAEAVLLALVSHFGFGESFTNREIAGVALILGGTMLTAT